MATANLTPDLLFPEAAQIWLDSRRHKLHPRTVGDYGQYIKALKKRTFGSLRLAEISARHFSEYQVERSATAGPARINMECSTAQQVLKRAGLWNAIANDYEPLPVPTTGPGRALSPEEEKHLFAVAATSKRWKPLYCFMLISNGSTAGPGEVRNLQLQDIDLDRKEIRIRIGAKNKYRVRPLALDEDALWAINEMLARAKRKGATLPTHYLFPGNTRGEGKHDPTRPVRSWKTAWDSLIDEAKKGMPSLAGLRMYDLRHNAATKMLENPEISQVTAEAILGHNCVKTKLRYFHLHTDMRRKVAAVLNGGHVAAQAAQAAAKRDESKPPSQRHITAPAPAPPPAVSLGNFTGSTLAYLFPTGGAK